MELSLCRNPVMLSTVTPRFAVVMFHNSVIKKYADHAAAVNRKYCERHGYEFILMEYDDTANEPYYEKIRVCMEQLPRFDYVCWIDSDACFIDFTTKLEDVTREHDGDLITAGYTEGRGTDGSVIRPVVRGNAAGINTGVMIFKNTEWCRAFLARVWSLVPSKWAKHEQGILQELLLRDEMDAQSHISLVVPAGRLNHFDDRLDGGDHSSFVLHLWGTSASERVRVLSTLAGGEVPDGIQKHLSSDGTVVKVNL
jgi:hypothetical protein